jgi:hypothetical protein
MEASMRILPVAAALSFGVLAACTTYHERTVLVPEPAPVVATVPVATVPTPTAEACATYDFVPGTAEYRICADREREARRLGRMARGYGESRILADSRLSCSSYGLTPGTARYDRCVTREIDLRTPL